LGRYEERLSSASSQISPELALDVALDRLLICNDAFVCTYVFFSFTLDGIRSSLETRDGLSGATKFL
jgi:hypothetical protein